MSSCANNLSPENGSCNHQCATITVAESPSRAGKGKDEEEEYDEDEDVDFNPFLKETSPAASSSLSSEIEVLDSEIVHRGEIVDNVVGTSSLKHPDEVPSNDFGLGEIGEEKMFMQTDAPSFTKAEEELDQTTGRDSKRKLSEFATQTEGDNLREKENTVNYLAKVNGNAETDLSYMPQSQEPTLKSAEEDAICMRTRARYSLASFSLDELEAFLQETDDEDDMHNVNDEEEYRKFLAAVLQGGEEDGHSIEQNENSDDDEDNDADFELELEELLESDDDEATAGKAENGEKINAGRRPQTRRNRKQKASIQHKRIFSEQIKRPLRPLVPILPNETIVPVDRNALMAETTTGSDLIYGFSPLQLDQLHCLIHEHAQLLIQVFSLCVLDPARQHIATQVQGLISDMLCRREELIACRKEPHCLDRGLVSSVLDVRSLNLAKRYMDDVSIAVQDYRQRQLESSCHTSCEREPLFPQPLHISLPKGNSDVQAGGFVAASNPVQSSSSQQQSKKTLAATLVESAKKESVALVPKEISKLAQRFFPLFNSSLFPHRPPPSGVANRVLFTDAEDELLALGIMEYNSDWKAIQQRFLPCKSKHQIFVRQKNRTSSKAPENPIKAVRKMKSSPLTAEEIVRIQEALKYFRFDWMSVWKFIVPYRDPSLLPRQWRIALGVQKSYKQDAAKKEKRRLYDLNRRRSASENGHLASEKEDGHAVNWNKNNGGDCLVDNAGEAYVHEGFLADWRPGFSNFLSSEPQSSNAMGKDQPNNTPSTDGSIRNTQLPTCITGRLQGKQPSDHLSNLTNFSSKNLQQSPYTSNMGSTASRSQIYLRPYRARKSYNTNMVRLAPDLPPVNLPPSVRVISESSFNRVTKVSAVKNGISVAGRDKTIPQTQSLESETAQLVKARDGTTDPLSDKVTGLCQEKSEALKATCITEERGTDPDLEMHPLLFQNPEKEDVVHYSTSRATGASSSFSFFPEDRPQLLSLFNIPRQVNHTADHVKNPANSMELNMASETSGFHPLLQRLDDANDNVIVPCKNLKVSTGLESISCQPKNVSRAVETVAFSSRPSVYSERLKKVNLDIHLSSTSVQEKCSSDLTAKANFSQSTYRSSPENNDDIHAVFPDRDVRESAAPDNRISGFGMDEIGDQSNLGIVMEQEELSDSDEETDENVEFECEEMADSEAEEGSCEEVAEMSDKRNGSRVVERVGADADSSNEQGFGNSQGTMSNSRTRSPSFRRSTVSELGRDSIKSPWLSLDSSRSPLKRNAKHKERRTGKEAMAKTTISCRPSRSSKKAACLTKRVAESKEEVGIAGLLSLGPGDSPLVKKPRKRVCRTNANLNVGTPQEISRPDDKDTSR